MFQPSTALPPAGVPLPDPGLKEILRRCSIPTYDAARAFRLTGNPRYLGTVVRGILEHQVDEDRVARLGRGDESLLLAEDLGIDSLSLVEIASLAEDALGIRLEDSEVRALRTVGDIERTLARGRGHPGGAAMEN